jgi:hypothetical protein
MKGLDNTYAVSTHVPMIKMVLELYNPAFILELGTGLHSTPLFLAHKCSRIFVENDIEWLKFMGGNEIKIIHNTSPEYDVTNMPPKVKKEITEYYRNLHECINIKSPALLFVDNFLSCRNIAINVLNPLFDIIIYHDCDPSFKEKIGYEFKGKGFKSYILKCDSRWTGLLIRNSASLKKMKVLIEPYIELFCKENNIANNWELCESE